MTEYSSIIKSSGTRQVHFGTISIRRYDIMPGDQPDCKEGFPIQLDWTFDEDAPVDVRLYEIMMIGTTTTSNLSKRRREELRLTGKDRWQRLRRAGYSKEELKAANPNQYRMDIRARVLQDRDKALMLRLGLQESAPNPLMLTASTESGHPSGVAGISV